MRLSGGVLALRNSLVTDLKVLVVADDPLARGGVSSMLSGRHGLLVAGQVSVEDGVPEAADAYAADVIAWDLGLEPTSGNDRFAKLHRSLPPVVVLLADDALAGRVWSAGAKGIVHRDAPPRQLAAALLATAEGLVVVDSDAGEALLHRSGVAPVPAGTLTMRELEVLRLLAEGYSNKELAGRLEVTENTVKFHVNAILGKLGAQSRTEAVTRASRCQTHPNG